MYQKHAGNHHDGNHKTVFMF